MARTSGDTALPTRSRLEKGGPHAFQCTLPLRRAGCSVVVRKANGSLQLAYLVTKRGEPLWLKDLDQAHCELVDIGRHIGREQEIVSQVREGDQVILRSPKVRIRFDAQTARRPPPLPNRAKGVTARTQREQGERIRAYQLSYLAHRAELRFALQCPSPDCLIVLSTMSQTSLSNCGPFSV